MSNANITDIGTKEVNADETPLKPTLNVRVPGLIKTLFNIIPCVLYEVTGLYEKSEGLDNDGSPLDGLNDDSIIIKTSLR
ncbi:14402_t:CDS:1, partial [Racocetra fulgida]